MSEENCALKKVSEYSEEEVAKVQEWINTEEYKELNFAREALVVNPAHACNPLGAQYVAYGFDGCMPFVHGSQGCASYFRSTFNRHYREPAPAVCSSMTEDGAVFGGQANLHDGLKNAYELYKPKMMAVFTSCMPEVIGDDLTAFINNAKKDGLIPEDLPTPYANTPSFNGTHINGYDAMIKAVLEYLTKEKKAEATTEAINIIPGFEPNTGNLKEYKKFFEAIGVEGDILGDVTDVFDAPLTGEYSYYPGGTPIEVAEESINAKATLVMQKYSTKNTVKFLNNEFLGETVELPYPMGIKATDELLVKLSELSGKPVPESLKKERGQAVDAMTDAHQYFHGKKVALFGDPDQLLGTVAFLLEMGAKPWHVLCSRQTKKFKKEMEELLASSPYGEGCTVYVNKDLWHLRSLLVTDPVEIVIGDTHGKFAAKDADTPLIRVGFPIMDRVNTHRYPTIGYQGAINMVTWFANTVMEQMDEKGEERRFEMMR